MNEALDRILTGLNPSQIDVVCHKDGTAVVMAGAGSGKTHTLMARVAKLVSEGVQPERILAVTFTNAAADEMKSRSESLLDKRCGGIVACTYHKFCNMMLRHYGERIGVKDYTILSYPDVKNMIDYVKSADPVFDNLKGFPSAGMVADMMSMIVNKQTDLETLLASEDKFQKYGNYVNEIQYLIDSIVKYGRDNQMLTYDDLLLDMNELLADDEICQKIAGRYQYIMVDEFQDTNNLQESIIWKLHQFNKNILVVGDISQSIYAFRGANVRNLQDFGDVMGDAKTYVLAENYRSSVQILDAANAVMNGMGVSWTYHDMCAMNKRGDKPIIRKCADTFKQNDEVMSIIDAHHKAGLNYRDMAILSRNSMETFGIENQLVQKGIHYVKMGGMKFMDYDCIGDMLAYFNVITEPYNLLAWFRILKLHPYIGKIFAKRIADTCQAADFLTDNAYTKRQFYPELQLLDNTIKSFRAMDDFRAMFRAVSDFYFKLRERNLMVSRMSDEAKEEEKLSIANDRNVVKVLEGMAMKYDDCRQFVDDIVLDSVAGTEEAENDTLTVTTVHSAKGLEWSLVIILDCVEGCFPSRIKPSQFRTPADEEELRCFYVAMTRAKDNLIMMVPGIRMGFDGPEKTEISHYLKNVGDTCTIM